MKMRTLLALSFVTAGVAANAGLDMNHIAPVGSLVSTAGFGVMQIFGDFPDFSGTVIDDFKASGSTVNLVGVAYELSNPQMNFANIKGWQVSLWNNPTDASNSGNGLNGNTAAQVLAAPGSVTTTEIFGTGTASRTFETDIPVSLGVTVGNVYWIGIAPLLDFTNNGQTFILSNTAPSVLGN